MFHLYSTHGLDFDILEKLAEMEDMFLDKSSFDECMQRTKNKYCKHTDGDLLNLIVDNLHLEKTDNSGKYNYVFDDQLQEYHVKSLNATILAIISDNKLVGNTKDTASNSIFVIVNKSPFYYESGGQDSDSGCLMKDNVEYPLLSVSNRKDFLLHKINIKDLEKQSKYLKVGDAVELLVDNKKRTKITRNHSGTHLLNAAIRKLVSAPIYQKSSFVGNENFKIELAVFGQKLSVAHIHEIESFLR